MRQVSRACAGRSKRLHDSERKWKKYERVPDEWMEVDEYDEEDGDGARQEGSKAYLLKKPKQKGPMGKFFTNIN